MNNRIMAMLFALVAAMFISIVPVKAEAATCKHTSTTWKSDEYEHRKVCKSCGEIVATSIGAHTDVYYTEKGDTHVMKCRTCGYTEHQAHVAYDDNGVCRCVKCRVLLEHTTEWVKGDENHAKQCTVCGTITEKAAHEWVITAGENKTHTKKCSICEKVVTEACSDVATDKDCVCDTCGNADINHSPKEVEGKAATCTEAGVSGHLKCEFCGKLFSKSIANKELTVEDVTIKAEGHDESVKWFNDETSHWHVCKNDGCEVEKLSEAEHALIWKYDDGYHWAYCEECGYNAEGTHHEYTYTPIEGQYKHSAKCGVCGKEVASVGCADTDGDHKCDKCGGAIKHGYNDGCMGEVIYKKVTCTEDGTKTHKECGVCGLKMRPDGTVVTDADLVNKSEGHEMEYVHNDEGHWQKCKNCDEKTDLVAHDASAYTCVEGSYQHALNCATCGRGSSAYYLSCVDENDDCACDLCGGLMKHVRADLTYHSTKKATCTTDGSMGHFTCNTCGKVFTGSEAKGFTLYTESVVREALGHDLAVAGITAGGQHQMICTRCNVFVSKSHFSEDGDCTCDVPGCEVPAHSHKMIYVAATDATCTAEGTEAYYKYEGCGRMFDLYQNEISAPVTTAATGHDFGDEWIPCEDGVHAKFCANCDEFISEAHIFSNGNVTCAACGAEEELTHVAAVAATCTTNGNVEYWQSAVTGKKYADAAGARELSDVVLKATGHNMSGWQDTKDGVSHEQVCMNDGCDYKLTDYHTKTEGLCYCVDCNGGLAEHALTLKAMVPATCVKTGTEAYFECSCGKLYDMSGNEIEAPAVIAVTEHTITDEVKKDVKANKHYIECVDCGYKIYENHVMVVEDPLKGNYHQWICECGELETEVHYDKTGDGKCDECGHEMNSKSVTVENHDSKTVITGDKNTVSATKSWWQNWLDALKPSNAGGTTATKDTTTSTSGSNASTGNASAGSNASTGNASTGNASTGSNASTGNASTGSNTTSGSTASGNTSTADNGVIAEFFQWLGELFNAWFSGK